MLLLRDERARLGCNAGMGLLFRQRVTEQRNGDYPGAPEVASEYLTGNDPGLYSALCL